jgi:hypothetical protein
MESFLITLLIVVVILALFFWAISMIPMDARVKQILYVVVAVIFAIWLILRLLPFAELR